MKNILLINDTTDLENWGAQAGIDCLKQNVHKHIPNASIRSLSYTWIARHYFVSHPVFGKKISSADNVIKYFSREYQFLPLVVDEFEYIYNLWKAGKGGPQGSEFFEIIKKTDIVVFNAEGSVYRNNFTAIKGLYLLWIAKSKFGIPSYFVNGSVTLTRVDPILPAMVGKTFSILDGISVREPYSLRNISEYFPGIKVDQIPDSAFLLNTKSEDMENKISNKYGKIRKELTGQPYFCISLPILLAKIENYYRQPLDQSPLVYIIRQLKKIIPKAIILAKEPSELFLEQVANDVGAIYVGPDFNYYDVLDILRGAEFLISGRYHHLIFASIVGCPSIPLASSSHKVHGLCELLENTIGYPHDPTNFYEASDRIVEQANAILNKSVSLKSKLLALAEKLSERSDAVGELISHSL